MVIVVTGDQDLTGISLVDALPVFRERKAVKADDHCHHLNHHAAVSFALAVNETGAFGGMIWMERRRTLGGPRSTTVT